MPLQLEYFKEYQQRLSNKIGEKRAKELVNQALVLISLGGNDFVNNYFLYPFSVRSQEASLSDYVRYLISEYRKILVVSVFSFFLNMMLVCTKHYSNLHIKILECFIL